MVPSRWLSSALAPSTKATAISALCIITVTAQEAVQCRKGSHHSSCLRALHPNMPRMGISKVKQTSAGAAGDAAGDSRFQQKCSCHCCWAAVTASALAQLLPCCRQTNSPLPTLRAGPGVWEEGGERFCLPSLAKGSHQTTS